MSTKAEELPVEPPLEGGTPEAPLGEGQSAEPTQNTIETRTQLVTLYVRGDINDAKALYGATPGSQSEGWDSLERMLSPVKQFVQDGAPPYVQPVFVGNQPAMAVTAGEQTFAEEQANIEAQKETTVLPEAQPTQTSTSGREVPVSERGSGVLVGDSGQGGETGTRASELIDRARQASNKEELDEIESQANNRVTVLDAVDARRKELNI